jgi:hypothetical protein
MSEEPDMLGDLNGLFEIAGKLTGSARSALQDRLKDPAAAAALSPQQTEFFLGELNADQVRIENIRALLEAGKVTIPMAAPDHAIGVIENIKDALSKIPAGPELSVRLEHAPYIVDMLDDVLKGFRKLCTPHSSGGSPEEAVLRMLPPSSAEPTVPAAAQMTSQIRS